MGTLLVGDTVGETVSGRHSWKETELGRQMVGDRVGRQLVGDTVEETVGRRHSWRASW